MTTRRAFLQALSTGVLASASGPFAASPPAVGHAAGSAAPKHPFTGQLGLQLYSLRHLFAKGDVPATLAMVKGWGLTNVELAGTYGMSAADYAALLKKIGLNAVATHADFGKLSSDIDAVIAEARTLGVEYLGCAWIPHGDRFTLADVDKSASVFNAAGKKANAAGLRFFYHIHGYEFQPAPDGGTLFDALATRTDPALVAFEMDIFWAVRGGAQPVDLFTRYGSRFPLTHVKDMRRGTAVGDPTGHAPDETSVPLGEGMIEWPPIVRAANKVGAKYHFIEDEAPEAEKQIPKTLQYLAALQA